MLTIDIKPVRHPSVPALLVLDKMLNEKIFDRFHLVYGLVVSVLQVH